MVPVYIISSIFIITNLIPFLMMAYDKRISRRGGETERIPEGLLFFMAAAFGAIGVYLGMLAFRHKTRKWYFLLGIPLLILENIATVYLATLLLEI